MHEHVYDCFTIAWRPVYRPVLISSSWIQFLHLKGENTAPSFKESCSEWNEMRGSVISAHTKGTLATRNTCNRIWPRSLEHRKANGLSLLKGVKRVHSGTPLQGSILPPTQQQPLGHSEKQWSFFGLLDQPKPFNSVEGSQTLIFSQTLCMRMFCLQLYLPPL